MPWVEPDAVGPLPVLTSIAATAPVKPSEAAQEAQETRRLAAERCLWWWNLSIGLIYFVWAVACFLIGASNSRAGRFRMLTITAYPDWSGGWAQGPVPDTQARHLIRFTALTSGFAWLSCLSHFLVLVLFPLYVKDLREGVNRIRWYEYAASSSLLTVLVAMLVGVWEAHTLFLIGAMTACMALFGHAHEMQQSVPTGEPADWCNLLSACFAGACPCAVILSYAGSTRGGSVPGFVWAVLAAYLVGLGALPANMLLQHARVGPWYRDEAGGFPGAGYYFAERAYQALSLVSKSLLLWLIVGGTNLPSTPSGA